LPEVTDRQLARLFDDPIIGTVLADDQPKHRALARTVRADQADLLARIDLKRRVDEQDLAAVLLGHRGERDHERVRIARRARITRTPKIANSNADAAMQIHAEMPDGSGTTAASVSEPASVIVVLIGTCTLGAAALGISTIGSRSPVSTAPLACSAIRFAAAARSTVVDNTISPWISERSLPMLAAAITTT
jgi:hypothetical protein